MLITTATYTDIGGRSHNEDAVGVRTIGQEKACLVVADGLGGHGGGDRASQTATRIILDGWDAGSTPDSLAALVKQAHREIVAMQTPVCRMKSTAVVLSLEDGRACWAHAGDTRLYHFLNGKLVFQTRDHSASQIAVALGQITPDQIRFHEDRSRIFRALGMEGDLSVDTAQKPLEKGKHAFLLCSDGFWEYVYESEMQRTLVASATPQGWLDRMVNFLQRRIPTDNDNNTAAAAWLTV